MTSPLQLWISFAGVQILSFFMLIQGLYLMFNSKKINEIASKSQAKKFGIWSIVIGSMGLVFAVYLIIILMMK